MISAFALLPFKLVSLAWIAAIGQFDNPADLTDADVDRMVEVRIARLKSFQNIEPGTKSGRFDGEMGGVHTGGVTALATLALLSAGLGEEDNAVNTALAYLAEVNMTGTYARALRANVWAQLLPRASANRRAHYLRLLHKDTDWLVEAMNASGWYSYGMERQRGDHSCSQFGVLGTWIGDDAGVSVPAAYWSRVSKQWLETQNADGSWSYNADQPGTPTMTTAGITTLYITLGMMHARREPAYRLFEGIALDGQRLEAVRTTMSAADSGSRWLADCPLIPELWRDYQLFGLQRLNLASGYKFIGGRDWFREGLKAIKNVPEAGTIETAFQLIFLTTGRAPVLFNKLQYGDDFTWNRYYRDLFFLTRELSREHENLYRWQIVSLDAPLHDFHDAPFLVIEGDKPLALDDFQMAKLRDYIDGGGTIIGHADGASGPFAASFKELFSKVFADRGRSFSPLSHDHPVYSAVYRGGEHGWEKPIVIEGLDNGARTCVFLFPQDIAGAWHQDRREEHLDLFRIMSNLRVYAAPKYEELPKPLRPLHPVGPPAAPRGILRVGTLVHSGGWNAYPLLWPKFGERMRHGHGITVEVSIVDLAAQTPPTPPYKGGDTVSPPYQGGVRGGPSAGDVDLLHLTGHGACNLPEPSVNALAERLRRGQFLWIDAAGTQPAFIAAADNLFNSLAAALGGNITVMDESHSLISAPFAGVGPLRDVRVNSWADAALRKTNWPYLKTLTINDRTVAVFAPYDVTAAVTSHYVYGAGGYARQDAERLLTRIVLWRFEQLHPQ